MDIEQPHEQRTVEEEQFPELQNHKKANRTYYSSGGDVRNNYLVGSIDGSKTADVEVQESPSSIDKEASVFNDNTIHMSTPAIKSLDELDKIKIGPQEQVQILKGNEELGLCLGHVPPQSTNGIKGLQLGQSERRSDPGPVGNPPNQSNPGLKSSTNQLKRGRGRPRSLACTPEVHREVNQSLSFGINGDDILKANEACRIAKMRKPKAYREKTIISNLRRSRRLREASENPILGGAKPIVTSISQTASKRAMAKSLNHKKNLNDLFVFNNKPKFSPNRESDLKDQSTFSDIEEARRTWEIGKLLGLSSTSKDEIVIEALVKQQQNRKGHST